MKTRVLFIDDDPFIRKIYRDRLVAEGFELTTVDSAHDAQNTIANNNYDIVVVDNVLAGMSGPDFVRWLRTEQKNDTPVIMMSALNQEEDVQEALKAGVTRYVPKDTTPPATLVATIKELTTKSQAN